MMPVDVEDSHRLVDYKYACALTSLSRSTLERLIRSGNFPKPVRVSPGRDNFHLPELRGWVAARIAERGGAYLAERDGES